MLTLSTPIPTSLRGQVRALVKAHADWHCFLDERDMISAQARNADLIEFALRHPTLTAHIEALLDNYTTATPKESAAVLMLTARVEKLLAAYAVRKRADATLEDFNYVGSRHHY
jgi:hypothetical protein